MAHTRGLIPPGLVRGPGRAGLPELGEVDFVLLHGPRAGRGAADAADALAAAILRAAPACDRLRPPPPAAGAGRRAVTRPRRGRRGVSGTGRCGWTIPDRDLLNPQPRADAFACEPIFAPWTSAGPRTSSGIGTLSRRVAGGVASRRCAERHKEQVLREFTVPPMAAAPQVGGLADAVFDHAEEDPHRVVLGRKDADGSWQDVTSARVPRRGARARQGAARPGRPVRRPGRASCPVPATSGPSSTSRCGRSAPSPCRSTRPPPPSRSAGCCTTPRCTAVRGRARGPRDDDRLGHRPAAPAAAAVAAGRGRRRRSCRGRRGTSTTRWCTGTGCAVTPDSIGHDHLHLGHHRPPQGLCASPTPTSCSRRTP